MTDPLTVTPDLLTRALRDAGAIDEGAAVADVAVEPLGAGQMARNDRLTLGYSGSGAGPATLVVKRPSTDPKSLQMAAGLGAYVREVGFYADLLDGLAVRVPRPFVARRGEDATEFLLVLEDLHDARTLDQLTGCDADVAALALEQAAALHGSSWGVPQVAAHPWLPGADIWAGIAGSVPAAVEPFLERFGPHLDEEQAAVVRRLAQVAPAWARTVRTPQALWHGDFRLDNLLLSADGAQVTVVDWQSVMPGPAATDVAYFLGTSMTPEARRPAERDLLEHYHAAAVAHGAEGWSLEDLLLEHRAHALFALVLTVPISLGVERTERGDAMFGAIASRAAAHALDAEAFDALATLERRG